MPSARVDRIASATLRRLTDLGFSLDTVEFMKPNSVASRGRSSGTTRTPAWPTTMGMPGVTWIIGTHRAVPPAAIDRDPAVHLLVLHVDPTAMESHLGLLIGCAVEVLGKGPGDVGRHGPRVFRVDRRGAVLDQVSQDRVDRFGRVRPDRDPGVARIRPADPDLAFVDLERPPHLKDPIEDLGEQERVDDVAANLDLIDHAGRSSGLRHRQSSRGDSGHPAACQNCDPHYGQAWAISASLPATGFRCVTRFDNS